MGEVTHQLYENNMQFWIKPNRFCTEKLRLEDWEEKIKQERPLFPDEAMEVKR